MPVSTSPVEDALAVDPGGNAPPGRRWKPRSGGLIALPALLLIAVCFVLPVGNILRLSLMEPVAGFGNYAHLATESLYGRIALTTLRISVLTTIIVVALGYLVAYVIAQAGPRLRSWLLLIVLIPFWMSVLVRAFAWILLLQREGLLNSALLSLGLIQQPLSLLRNETGVLIGMGVRHRTGRIARFVARTGNKAGFSGSCGESQRFRNASTEDARSGERGRFGSA